MISVDIQTWGAVAAVVSAMVAIFGLLSHKIEKALAGLDSRIEKGLAGLDSRIDRSGAQLNSKITDEIAGVRTEIADVRTEMRAGFATVDNRLATLERRTYDLSTRLPPSPAAAGHRDS